MQYTNTLPPIEWWRWWRWWWWWWRWWWCSWFGFLISRLAWLLRERRGTNEVGVCQVLKPAQEFRLAASAWFGMHLQTLYIFLSFWQVRDWDCVLSWILVCFRRSPRVHPGAEPDRCNPGSHAEQEFGCLVGLAWLARLAWIWNFRARWWSKPCFRCVTRQPQCSRVFVASNSETPSSWPFAEHDRTTFRLDTPTE